jgi:hypothetical protein
MTIKNNLEAQLEREIIKACKKSERHVGFRAKRPLELLSVYGPVGTVKRLVGRNYINDAFVDLVLAGKHTLTLEYIISQSKYRGLFDEELVKHAQKKLAFN